MMPFCEKPPVILLADDNVETRAALEYMLRAQGYQVICAEDGDRALMALAEHSVDLALLDVRMPGRSGFDVCREIKTNTQTRLIPVILITGLADSESRVEGIECGADDFIA